ncbi:HK97-gp10 family putative phage morphogenesis protein [Halobacillus massiliensis]|uniref:HK97-gp10 family putative phage morphogenesis protein n=1 Tax=Halobacillus massiliensis TaxID=1926286 RepID=UPI0009E6080F|nr:HK97-gp10 family putative phage morphogenesis protein [Halobacillus massiliensis]
MDLNGLDKLLADLNRMDNEIEDDVSTIVKNNTIEQTGEVIKNAVFVKGYQTGFTRRNIETERVDKLHFRTISKSEHSAFLEYGTRYMDAQPFVYPGYFKQKSLFLSDLKRLVE